MNLKYMIAKGFKRLLNPPALRNCSIDKTAKVCPKSELSRVSLGRYSYIGSDCFMVNTKIGAFCSIADDVVIGGATHPIQYVSTSPVFHKGQNILKKNFATHESIKTPQTQIENDVWIGMGSFVKAGITIHDGAVIGMGSVVTHDVPAYEIWAGNPAKMIRKRFDTDVADRLEKTKWWDLEESDIEKLADLMNDPESFLKAIED